ncbi:MAG: DUF3781 domain-containing protein [Oscillospiraceae bacterium]|nr:DUF3781 domain-containing protein [Oscillospiraceae bacterium]
MKNALIENIAKLHTTEMGLERIKRNLDLTEDSVEWCRSKILDKDAVIERRGKNWYVGIDRCVITVNAGSYTIITAHSKKRVCHRTGHV